MRVKKRVIKPDEYKGISPGSMGGLIRRIRELRGLSRGELGVKAGFGPSVSSEVRIRQYEVNINTPRESAIMAIADALQIDSHSLLNTDFSDVGNMYHALFYMELFQALRPVKIGDCFYLEFGEINGLNQMVDGFRNRKFLEDWYNAIQYNAYAENAGEEKGISYAVWQYEYSAEELLLREKKEKFEERLGKITDLLGQ
jgi:Helix-turn-helix.